MASDDGKELWHRLRAKECAAALTATCQAMEKHQSPRRQRWARNCALYEGRPLGSLDPAAYFTTDELIHDDFDVLRMNLARMLVNAAHAKVAAKQRPKTRFMVSDGDWGAKRKAKKMERLNEALMLQRQGLSSDGWEEHLRAQLFAMVGDLGVVKTTANVSDEKVEIRAYPGYQFLVDPTDAMHGHPLTLIHVYPVDKFKTADEADSKHRDAIVKAPDLSAESYWAGVFGRTSDVSRIVLMREAWRLQLSEKSKGRHAGVIGGVDIFDEDYERDFFPCEFYVWEQWLQGIYGTSIVDTVYHLTVETNAQIQRMSDAMRHASNMFIDCEANSYDKEKLDGNIAKTILERRTGTPPVNIVVPEALSSSHVQWYQLLKGDGHDASGVSEMAATGQKESGVDSGAAMRQLSMIGTERFAVQWQAFERRSAVGQARQNIACVREVMTEHKDFAVKWPGKDFLQELKASDVVLDEDMYVIQPMPVSGTWNTPPDRLATAEELYSQQIIGATAVARIRESGDVSSELSGAGKWATYFDKQIESWLDATPESEEAGANGDPKGFRYWPPFKWMPLPDAIVQVGRAFADAIIEGCPDYNLQFFVRFMGDCSRELDKLEAAKAAAAAPPPAAVPMPGIVNGAPAAEMVPPVGMLQ